MEKKPEIPRVPGPAFWRRGYRSSNAWLAMAVEALERSLDDAIGCLPFWFVLCQSDAFRTPTRISLCFAPPSWSACDSFVVAFVNAPTRFASASAPCPVGTFRLVGARETRSTNTCSSLSQVPVAFVRASEIASCADFEARFCTDSPSFTRASNSFPPSSWALKRHRAHPAKYSPRTPGLPRQGGFRHPRRRVHPAGSSAPSLRGL